MALAYLLCPTFQIVNSAGKPATGGYLEVYLAGSRTKYFCSSDFDGTRHPFQIPLDSLGSNVVLADDSNRYDVYVYNRYGTLLMSRYNVSPGAGGGAGFGVLTSSDGSVTIVETANGYDLTVNVPAPSVLRAGADPLTSDGQFVFHELVRDGDKITVDDMGKIRLEQGWYHYDITVRIVWDTGAPVNKTVPLQLYTTLASDVLDFDASYSHNDTVRLSGETKIATSGSELVFGISGLEPGMGAELVDMGVHAIYVSFGEESNYQAGEYIDISPDKVISVTGVQPQSAMTSYAPIVSLSSYVPTADFTSYSSDVNSAITSLSSDVSSIGTDISSISSMVSGLTGVYLEQSASSLFAPSSLGTSKLDASASSSFAQASSLSGYIPTGESSNYQQTAGMTAYVPYSSVEGTGGHVTGINGSAIAGAAGHEYSGISPIVVDNTAETISIQTTGLAIDADTMSAWVSGDDVVIGVNPGILSGKLDSSAQVVTATATQLYAGTAYLTSVNGAPVSASRAGQAVNASMATSAYYDGTGRLISSLPDRAEVSAIASAYATGGGGGVVYTSPSGTIVVAGNTLEGTNSAALTAASGGYVEILPLATFQDVTISTSPIQITYGNLPNTSTGGEFILDFSSPLYGGTLFISGRDSAYNTVSASAGLGTDTYTASVPQGKIVNQIYAWTDGSWLHLSSDITASAAPQVITTGVGQLAWHSALTGVSSTVANNSAAWGQGGVSPSTVSSIASSYATSAVSSKLDTSAFSAVSGSFLTAVPAGYASETYVDSSVSSKLDTSAFSAASGSFLTAVPAGYATEAYVDSSVSGKQDSSAMSAYLPFSAISADENSAITSINGSSVGGTQVVTATGSASLKVKTTGTGRTTSTAEFITGINGTPIAVSTLSSNTTQIVENYILAFSPTNSMWTTSTVATGVFAPLQYGTGAGLFIDNAAFRGYIKGNEYFVSNESYGYVRGEVHQTRGCRTIVQSTASAYASIVAKSNSAYLELSGVGAAAPVQITPSSVTAWDTVTAKMDSTAVQSAYASASASQATAQGVLYILIPDGV